MFNNNGADSNLLVNGTEIYKFKAKDLQINVAPLCLGNTSEDFSAENIKRNGLDGYVYRFFRLL